MNFYKHHLGDYDGDTAHLTWDEDMAYTRLMRTYYRREKPFADTTEAYRLCRAQSKPQRAAVQSVLTEFFNEQPDGWHNKRCDEEIAAFQSQANTNKRIARERWGNEPSTNRTRSVHEPSTNTEQKRTPNQIPEPLTSKHPAAKAADPVKEEIWKTGKTLLSVNGETKDAASFLGKLCKEYGQILVLQAVRDCVVATPAEPKAWLVARCQERRQKEKGNGKFNPVQYINEQQRAEQALARSMDEKVVGSGTA